MEKSFHYTSINGFKGIIEDKNIRMTRSEFLNDPYDCQLFTELVDKYLTENKKEVVDECLKNHNSSVSYLYNNNCDLVSFIKYMQNNVRLYVMSLTEAEDAMNMWNCYGYSGVQLELSLKELEQKLKNNLTIDEEYIFSSKVIYTNLNAKLNEIKIPTFLDFKLLRKNSDNVFVENKNSLDKNSSHFNSKLYDTNNLEGFINTYLDSYILCIKHLIKNKVISENMSNEVVLQHIFNNLSNLNKDMLWKKDLNLYMLVLLSLIKSDTYKHENEYRIVYFENNISQKKQKGEKYGIKNIDSKQFLYPYITFGYKNNFISSITLSPLTNNLSINKEIYKNTIKSFMLSNGFEDEPIKVEYSKHKIRW